MVAKQQCEHREILISPFRPSLDDPHNVARIRLLLVFATAPIMVLYPSPYTNEFSWYFGKWEMSIFPILQPWNDELGYLSLRKRENILT